ncbi:hypothetical protein [Phenylobacterium sp. NIBR 498073]|jgi:hypothetical protein|uniref:hypothetical protein n=1 Tax=Phenylobacterium sp. NIBR 498073 TaxID=3015177 RepID=UPI0022B5CF6A|nr:hypothetical protein [Phenylobacterium sp. NIBR 498073]WGU40334.1 hypothetical protein O4N75_01055 [Phenylobacterium sp. NIBR 498073]
MNSPRRTPLRFTRGGRAYVIAPAYAANDAGYIGICDGRIVASAVEPAEVARNLITQRLLDPIDRAE